MNLPSWLLSVAGLGKHFGGDTCPNFLGWNKQIMHQPFSFAEGTLRSKLNPQRPLQPRQPLSELSHPFPYPQCNLDIGNTVTMS